MLKMPFLYAAILVILFMIGGFFALDLREESENGEMKSDNNILRIGDRNFSLKSGSSLGIDGNPPSGLRKVKLWLKMRVLRLVVGDDVVIYNVGSPGHPTEIYYSGNGDLFMEGSTDVSVHWYRAADGQVEQSR